MTDREKALIILLVFAVPVILVLVVPSRLYPTTAIPEAVRVVYKQDVVLLKPAARQLVKGLTPRLVLDPPAGRPLREWTDRAGHVCYTEVCQDEVLGGWYRLNLVVLLKGKGEMAAGEVFWSSGEIQKIKDQPEKFLASRE